MTPPEAPVVYVTRAIAPAALDLIAEPCDLRLWQEDRPIPRDALLGAVGAVVGLLTMLTERVDTELLDAAPRLKVVSNMAVGYDNIDVPAVTARGIPVGNTPGVLTEASADHAFALLMAAARRLTEAERYVRAGQWTTWSPSLLLGRDIHGATLGIVGLGRIGLAVARRARGFGMRVLHHGGHDPDGYAQPRELDDLLRASDFVSLHVPLRPETHHLIGARELALMQPTAILINTARGGVVDPMALYDALKAGRIAAAALDVTEPEPIRPDDPLLTLDNCLIVPHIASATVATREQMALLAARNLIAGVRGERPPHVVNPAVYDLPFNS
jgi:lactate dehydrogenase-like 2-hydroxyacid dehydrogenase